MPPNGNVKLRNRRLNYSLNSNTPTLCPTRSVHILQHHTSIWGLSRDQYLTHCPLEDAGVDGAVRFLVVGTIGQEERPPRGQLWIEQCLTLLKYWPIKFTIWADPNYTWGLAILSDSLLFSVNNILAGLWLNYISSVEITLFLLADILLQHRALFQC